MGNGRMHTEMYLRTASARVWMRSAMPKRIATTMAVSLMLLSCGGKPEALPSQEVLKRALITGYTLQSADIDADAELTLPGFLRMHGRVTGSLRNGGLTLQATASGTVNADSAEQPVSLAGILTIPGTGETFLRIDELEIPGRDAVLAAGFGDSSAALQRWWRAGNNERPAAVRETADARHIERQMQSLRIDKDMGMERSDAGYAYHYAVTIDPQASVQNGESDAMPDLRGSGEIWIDARTFRLLRAKWIVADIPLAGTLGSVLLDVRLRNHGKGGHLVLPDNDAEPVPDDGAFAIFLSGSLLP